MPLTPLLANQSVEKILYYLLLNGKCYATQLSKKFQAPLTPLQQALQKLEEQEVLSSFYEGKTRYFEFNPSYPLLKELEELLKRAYTLLDFETKKIYYSPQLQQVKQTEKKNLKDSKKTILTFWERLHAIQSFSLSAKSKAFTLTGWNGLGKGNVDSKVVNDDTLIFHEQGKWINREQNNMEFRNTYKWNLHKSQNLISLEHLRFGIQNPVFLFKLRPIDEFTLESIDPHHCKDDAYFGKVRCDSHYIQLNWRVIGPRKNEEIDYLYT